MRAPAVIKADPITDDAAGMLSRLEPMAVYTLLHQCADDPFNHSILLWAVRRDELLLQHLNVYQSRVAAADKNQAIVGP